MSRDPDQEYFVGCAVSSILGILVLVPPIVLCVIDSTGAKSIYTSAGLVKLVGISGAAATICSLVGVRKYGIPAAFGAMGGFICGCAYWFLHLQQSIAKSQVDVGRLPEYLDQTMIIVPIIWLILGAVVSFLPLLKNQRLKRED
jgi:hypothetical protein